MKIALQYLSDANGNIQAAQLPLAEWKKVLKRLKKYEQALKLKSDLTEALEQVDVLKQSTGHKQTLNQFLDSI